MGQLGGKLRKTVEGYVHWCPACEEMHVFFVDRPTRKGARWGFDGNVDAPTFTPSMNITVGPDEDGKVERCHYFLRVGQLEFCGDSTHALAGRTVPLPDLPPHLRDAG